MFLPRSLRVPRPPSAATSKAAAKPAHVEPTKTVINTTFVPLPIVNPIPDIDPTPTQTIAPFPPPQTSSFSLVTEYVSLPF